MEAETEANNSKTERSDIEETEEEDEADTFDHYTEKVWCMDETNKRPSNFLLSGNTPEFEAAVIQLKVSLKKDAKAYSENVVAHVRLVTVKHSSTEAKIDIIQNKLKGSIILTYWPKHPKTKLVKVQVDNVAKN